MNTPNTSGIAHQPRACDRQCDHLADLFYNHVTWEMLTTEEQEAFGRHVDHLGDVSA